MNQYQLAMFRSYWFPVALFYVVPVVIILVVNGPAPFWDWVASLIPVFALFGVGLALAPYIGPQIKKSKFVSFVMAYICLVCVYFVSIICFVYPSSMSLKGVLTGAVLVLLFGSLPAILGALFFIGACNRIHGSS